MKARTTVKRMVFGGGLVLFGIGLGLYLGVALPAGAQPPAEVEEWEFGDFPPGFGEFMPPPMAIAEGMYLLNEEYIYVMRGSTVYQFRHDRFPEGMKQFTFKPEARPLPRPMAPGVAPALGGPVPSEGVVTF